MKDRARGLAHILGFNIKIAERTGSTLKSKFPLNTLWDGAPCPREECVTCTQGIEEIPQCTKRNVLYENICALCNPTVGQKGELKEPNPHVPSIYVGESNRSIFERSKEHMKGAQGGKEESHMVKHMELHHRVGELPKFIMKPVKYFKSSLKRQIAEAVRIRRRGEGVVLNSKSEYSRCVIPRLAVEQREPNNAPLVEPQGTEDCKVWELELGLTREQCDRDVRLKLGPLCTTGGAKGPKNLNLPPQGLRNSNLPL